ncbi:putative U box domain, armadillo-like helical, Zinc finger, RING/FYVE/PHD-type [Helianthus annuus]|uniref:RING-type E3 ubiquitin transferase n=1 Tax=Helianthus annuus TaxID=4232 RepID=A0A251SBS0_HELAN|nr:U-box domain-containing protein 44 [Helianthus annuus]XP_035839652.1 U-box domain-containing protein 44 [Helianthus annuus]KAF5766397.1 putative U box domain, armadillo-like helical, Zinc finger, RING/FYVE/PHD-type [Helianthus annuus]KAJ0452785.1 putative U box domain, armadillo-like helical, Zinc finger, RING/FYVE/PHD-type [Helianthus annuus]KAJ0457790.1 putative U box domain, armadillo-like helical, Zinc finger, RING/FYVE/PHD-type [Helianthus annuus]KAJ0474697.1 putative U box domain, arm
MAGSWDGSRDIGSQSDDSFQYERKITEPIYDAFICPLSKQIMKDPVTIETGQTFEREAIEKWFDDCKENGRKLVCPMTLREVNTTDMNPSIALRKTIEEWNARNEAVQLDMAFKSLTLNSSESDILQALRFIQQFAGKNVSNKHIIRNAELIPSIVEMLKSTIRKVRLRALETLKIVVEDDNDNKEIMAEGDKVRTIVKFLNHEQSEREEAVSLLFELSKSESLCDKIGSVNGAILILVGMTSSKSENPLIVEKADKTLENLEKSENNVRQMAANGRLQPLLTLLLEGSHEIKVSMASYLGDLALSNDVKAYVATTVGSSLINLMKSNDMQSREAALKALNQVSSCEPSAKVLVDEGILSPLVKDLFAGPAHLPMRLKEVCATILANIVNSDSNFDSIPVGPNHQTLVSEDIIHNLLQLISNTGPSIECKLLQVLVGLTNSPATAVGVADAIKSLGATISLVQFIEAPQKDLRMVSIKLLQNLSIHMGLELADCLCGPAGHLSSLFKVIAENITSTEEQAAAIGIVADLPEMDVRLTTQMLDSGDFVIVVSRIKVIRQGETRSSRFVTPYLEGLVRVLSRITFVLPEDPKSVSFCRDYDLTGLFTELLQANGLDNVQMVSALALHNLSKESKHLTRLPELPSPGFCGSIFPCMSNQPVMMGLCRVHRGTCTQRDTFCLIEGQALARLVALLDHTNDKVVEASLRALSTLLDDGVNIEGAVNVLCEIEGIRPILDVLLEKQTESLKELAVWMVERLLRTTDIASEVSGDPSVTTALVDAFKHGDYQTRPIAERALKHIDRMPNFSGIFSNMG